jgi:hypothetical protein
MKLKFNMQSDIYHSNILMQQMCMNKVQNWSLMTTKVALRQLGCTCSSQQWLAGPKIHNWAKGPDARRRVQAGHLFEVIHQ